MSVQNPFNPSPVNVCCLLKIAKILMKWEILIKWIFFRKKRRKPSYRECLGLFLKRAKFEIFCKNYLLFNSKPNKFLKQH